MRGVIPKKEHSDHTRLSASSAHRWMNCPGAPDFEAQFEEKPNPAAVEGTCAHWLAEQFLSHGKPLHFYDEIYDETSDMTFEVTQEMQDAVQKYTDYVSYNSKGCEWIAEQRYDLSEIHPDLGGTCDCTILDTDNKLLTIVDYKHGRGVAVDAINNTQMRIYALGAILKLLEKKVSLKGFNVKMVIVQPRAAHPRGIIRDWTLPVDEIFIDFKSELKACAKRCNPEAPLVAGDWCKFCKARGECKVSSEYVKDVIKADFAKEPIVLPNPDKLSPEEINEILVHSTTIRDWLKSVETHAQAKIEMGTLRLKDYMLVVRGAHRKWKKGVEKEIVKRLGDKAYEKKLLSPAKAEKIADVEDLWEKPENGFILARRDSGKEEYISDAALDFLDSHDLL